jgi:hypothetical protein
MELKNFSVEFCDLVLKVVDEFISAMYFAFVVECVVEFSLILITFGFEFVKLLLGFHELSVEGLDFLFFFLNGFTFTGF